MKTAKEEMAGKKKLPKGFKINTNLTNKYQEERLFVDKVERANKILKTSGFPTI
jgi:hypothetical protein